MSNAHMSEDELSLTVAASRMHDALWRNGPWLEECPDDDVLTAYGQLQDALKALGWRW